MPEPYCLAMVLCDHVHRDATTGKFTILGTFSTLAAREFPAKVTFSLYFAITDGLGPTELRLRLVNASCGIANGSDDDNVVFQVAFDFEFTDPLMVLENASGIGTEIPVPGLYHCELWAGEELLMSRRLLATVSPKREEGEGGHNE